MDLFPLLNLSSLLLLGGQRIIPYAGSNPDDPDIRLCAGNIYHDVYVLAELYPQAVATLDKIHIQNADTAGDLDDRTSKLLEGEANR